MKPSPYALERKVFGLALTHTPVEVFQAVREETRGESPKFVGDTVAQYVKQDMVALSQAEDSSMEVIDDTLTFVSSGVRDVYKILRGELITRPHLTFEQSINIAQHPQTGRTIAALALRSEEALTDTLDYPSIPSIYRLDAAEQYLEPLDQLKTYRRGCPFAGREGIVEPDPLFVRFAAWSGTIAVQHYFDQPLV